MMNYPSALFLFLPTLSATAFAGCNLQEPDYSERYINTSPSVAPTPGPQPHFAQALRAAVAPPPISGGTLAVAPDGRTIVASDPDRDRIYVVDIPTRTVKHDIVLAPGSEPGRVAIDSHGFAHVGLRNTGALATIDLATGSKVERAICTAPRGVAFDAKVDSLHIACAEGVLVTVPLAAGAAIKRVGLDRDLRDVLVIKDKLYVSHFRGANVTVLTREGNVVGESTRGGNLGWRMVKAPAVSDKEENDDVALVSQDPVNPAPSTTGAGYYGSGAIDTCNSPTITTTRLDIPGETSINIPPAVLPVDLATNGREYAIVAAGNGHTPELPQIFIHQAKLRTSATTSSSSSGGFGGGFGTNPDCNEMAKGFVPGQAIAAAFDGEDQLIVQSREPAALYIMSPDRQRVYKEITLSTESREDTGHAIFHSNSGGFLACASCHAEGGEDGRTWEFVEGQRRTPSMLGTLAHTAPFHWDGEMKDLRQLVDHVFTSRMSGPKVDDEHVTTLQSWLFRLPPPPKVQKPADAVARGSQIFEARGCATCHSGADFTNNETVDVGTGARYQVPTLTGVGWRAPFLHNGCAKTLKDRFDGTACGGDKHGDVNGLNAADIADLTTFLDSL